VWLFTFLGFLLWLYIAANHSTVDDWWTVKTINKFTSENKDITPISPRHFISSIKVLIGSAIFSYVRNFAFFYSYEKKTMKTVLIYF